ncbi:MAG: hypothetical protein K2X11_18225 [Acetobacteraceae bacterium]|nr:hypothetical protein [Acetobacteraceae bacterium]
MTISRIALAVGILAAAGLAEPEAAHAQPGCAALSVVSTSTGTQRVPRMGPGSDLLTQSVIVRNAGGNDVRFSIALVHRAFQEDFVTGRTYDLRANGQMTIMLGNVLKPGLSLDSVRAGIRITCL